MAQGDEIVVRHGDVVWNPKSKQSLFDFEVSELEQKVTPHALQIVRETHSSEEDLEVGALDLQAKVKRAELEVERRRVLLKRRLLTDILGAVQKVGNDEDYHLILVLPDKMMQLCCELPLMKRRIWSGTCSNRSVAISER